MSQFALLGSRRFAPFFWTQALGAFNDNAFRSAMVAMVSYKMALPQDDISLYNNRDFSSCLISCFPRRQDSWRSGSKKRASFVM
jgi:hypothetical protein